jgi:hypothetical protein
VNQHTYAALVDELEKIAEVDRNQVVMKPDGTTGTIESIAKEYADRIKAAARQDREAAKKANDFFGLPLSVPPKKGVRVYENGAPQGADRSQQPIDAQSTANISAGGKMDPASGPAGP